MTLVYPYFRYLINSENNKSFVYYFSGLVDELVICWAPSVCDWEDMGNIFEGQAKGPSSVKDEENKPESSHHHHNTGENTDQIYTPVKKGHQKEKTCCRTCFKILFVILALINILKSIVVIAVAISTAIATKIYSSDVSGRMVAMIILAVTAAATLSVSIYALIAVFTNKKKPLHSATIALIILAIIQAVIIGVAVKVTPEDEIQLSRSLTESFRLAREDNPRHVKIWATTQHDLSCCGVYGPEDYRARRNPNYFPPDVPISCCPTHDPGRSDLVQEREREVCKARKTFYDVGCKTLVLEIFKDGASIMMSCCIALIVLQIILAIVGAILCKKNKVEKVLERTVVLESNGKPKT